MAQSIRHAVYCGIALAGVVLGAPPATAGDAVEQCLQRSGTPDVTICENAVERNPENLELRRALAHAYVEIGDFASAVNVYEVIAADRPNDPQALYDLGGSLGFIRRYHEAADVLERLARIEPDKVETYRSLAIVYEKLDQPQRVLSVTRTAAELGDPVAMFDMFLYLRDGIGAPSDNSGAIGWAEQAAQAGHMRASKTLVDIFLQGQLEQAVDETRAIKWARHLHELRQQQ